MISDFMCEDMLHFCEPSILYLFWLFNRSLIVDHTGLCCCRHLQCFYEKWQVTRHQADLEDHVFLVYKTVSLNFMCGLIVIAMGLK